MEKSICTFGYIPVRKDPEEQAEMVTQVLFGESYDITERIEKWCRIKLHTDGYEGWIDAKLVEKLSDKAVELWKNSPKWFVPGPFIKVVSEPEKSTHFISGGSQIVMNTADRNCFTIGTKDFCISSNYSISKPVGEITDVAYSFINVPYLWGGRNFFGLDCSGFVQIVYAIKEIQIPRDASQQVKLGTMVSFVEEAVAGDLAFFDDEEGNIVHVGMCLGKGEIIHASGRVRIDKFDHQGIFDNTTNKYTHKLRVIKRIIE
ncbi:C40 family peptidase [Carboxylicivirga linearis]|uniref:C40 family peptidase n=1 Tax=Carboxylicivirga linearis TaxID=1628157 RepID=A0ABS5JX39_9BACT|nr:C40 family peptidase [Carboxylicivirga linearis]MBS2099039.1 C40 family peptidase [Carboxylicivirga linearis]